MMISNLCKFLNKSKNRFCAKINAYISFCIEFKAVVFILLLEMDTIMKPRHLCSTATDESSSEEDDNDVVSFDKKDSTCSSKITVIPNCCSIGQIKMLEKEGIEECDDIELEDDEASSGSRIVCPTARFLQVNPKKVSSFDLLVRPPKRPRFINHPSREYIDRAKAFKQKTKPVSKPPLNPMSFSIPRKKSPVLESIYFENEKLRYRQTMSGNWSSSSSAASPRNQTNAKSHGPKPMKTQYLQPPEQLTSIYINPESLPQKFSEEETLRDIELSDAYHRNVYTDRVAAAAPALMEEYTKFVQAENSLSEENQDASSIFRTCFEDQSSTFAEHVILDEKTGEFRVIQHPDLRELQSESATVLDGDYFLENLADENGNIDTFQEDYKENEDDIEFDEDRLPKDSFDHLNGNRSSPLAIFLAGSMMGSVLDLGQDQNLDDLRLEMGSPFSNFGTEGEDSGEEVEGCDDGSDLDGLRIEDVTDLVGDDEQVDSVIHLVRSGEDGEGSTEMKTIFWANSSAGFSNKAGGKMTRVTSEPCHLMDGFKDKRREKKTTSEFSVSEQNSMDFQEEIDAQEFLLQPKPKLNLSSSFHSAFEKGNVQPTSTVAMFVEKRTKSDYFVGKIKGTPKSLLKPEFINSSKIKIKSNLGFSEDSKIDTGNDDTTDSSEGYRSEEENRPRDQPNLHKSSSALAIAVVNAKRKVSSGNRVSNAIPDKTQKKKGMSPVPPRNQTATTSHKRRGEVQQLSFPRVLQRSSSSSSHQQILMTIKAKSPPTIHAQNIENQKQKSILKKDKKPNFFMRIFGRLFGISTTEKLKKSASSRNNRIIDNLTPSVPSSILKRSDRGIVHHTDSKELYRERRRKFFNEQKEFQDESLA